LAHEPSFDTEWNMRHSPTRLTALFTILAALALGCGVEPNDSPEPGNGDGAGASRSGDERTNDAPATPITWCSLGLSRSGTVADTSLEYPSQPDTTWFNRSLEEVALSAIDETMMREAGLDPDDDADVRRFRYFLSGFDLRWIVREDPSPGNWFGKTDLGVYVFDLANTSAPLDGTTVAVFDASAVREARLSGDKPRLGEAIRAAVDAMKADPRPKAIIAFAPDRNPETSVERAFINLFARDVYFATTGSVTISNLRDSTGAPVTTVTYPLRDVRTLDVDARGDIAGSAITASGSCLDLTISG
jgi:hypothetical protein